MAAVSSVLSYVVDNSNQRVIKFNNAGVVQLIITANQANPPFLYPFNCVVDSNGALYVSKSAPSHT